MRRLILLDRDGTVMVNKHYLVDPDGVELIPGVAEGIRQLNEAGHGVAIISNQSGVARGMMTVNDVAKVNARLLAVLHVHGAAVDNIYFCPEVDDSAPCRKPNTGMLEQAARDLGLTLAEGVVVGDNVADIEAGQRAGCKTVLVRTGYGAEVEASGKAKPDVVVDSLLDAVQWILAQ